MVASGGSSQLSINFASCLSHRSQSNKQKLLMQHTKTQTMQSPFKQAFSKAGAAVYHQKKTTPQSHLRQKYVQMMNSTTQSSFVRSTGGAPHGSGKDLLAKQVQLPQISKQDSKKTFNRIRSEQRQAVNRHYANFQSNNYNGNQKNNSVKRKNLSSQPKVLTIGQVLLEQQKKTPQLPNITSNSNNSGHLSRNKELNQMIIESSTSGQNIVDQRKNCKKNSQSGLQTGVLQQVQREQHFQKMHLDQPSGQYQVFNTHTSQQSQKSNKQGGQTRPARIYTAKLASGTMKNFFFNNNQTNNQQQVTPSEQMYAASPNTNHERAQHKNLKSSNRSCMMHLSSNKLKMTSEKTPQANQGYPLPGQHQQPQLVVISSQPEGIHVTSASLDVLDSPQKSAPNSRKPSLANGHVAHGTRQSILQQTQQQQQQQFVEQSEYPMQMHAQRRQECAVIHYSSSQTQLQQLNTNPDFLFDDGEHAQDSGSIARVNGSRNVTGGSRHHVQASGTSALPIRKVQQQVANDYQRHGNPRRTLYSAKHVSQVYRPQPIQNLPTSQKHQQLVMSASKRKPKQIDQKKQSMQMVVKQNHNGGNQLQKMQNTQQQFYSKKQQQVQMASAATSATAVSHQVSSRPAQPVQSTNINSAPKSSATNAKLTQVNGGQPKKRTFVNQTASEIFVNHHPQQSTCTSVLDIQYQGQPGSFHQSNLTPSNMAGMNGQGGIRRSQVKAGGGPRITNMDEIMHLQQNSSMVQLNSGSPKQAMKRQRPVVTAVSTTMTPDLSQKFILFKEHRKRASINPGNNENQPSAIKSTTEDQFQYVSKPNVPSTRVHSTLAHYNNHLNFEQPTASQSPQAREHLPTHPAAADLNTMMLSNLIQRGGYSRDNSVIFEQSRSASQMQYKTKPEQHTTNAATFSKVGGMEGHRDSIVGGNEKQGCMTGCGKDRLKLSQNYLQQQREASPQFNGLQRSETVDNRNKTSRGAAQKLVPQNVPDFSNQQQQIQTSGQVVIGEKYKQYAVQGKASQNQQQSDIQHIMKKRLVYSSYLRKSTQNESMAQHQRQQYQHQQHQAGQKAEQQNGSTKPTNKSHLRHNIRKR